MSKDSKINIFEGDSLSNQLVGNAHFVEALGVNSEWLFAGDQNGIVIAYDQQTY